MILTTAHATGLQIGIRQKLQEARKARVTCCTRSCASGVEARYQKNLMFSYYFKHGRSLTSRSIDNRFVEFNDPPSQPVT